MKTTPYSENMYGLFEQFVNIAKTTPGLKNLDIENMKFDIMGSQMTITQALSYLSSMIGEPWSEISSNTDLVNAQYEIVGGKWPEKQTKS